MRKAKNRKSLKRRILSRWQLYLFLLVPVIYVLVFQYYPMTGLQIAFKRFDITKGIWGSEWIGMENFRRFFSSYNFQRTIKNTIRISLYSLVAGFPLPVLLALTLNTIRNQKYKKFVQLVTYIPHFISTVVLIGMLMQFFNTRIGLYGIVYRAIMNEYPRDIMGIPSAFPHLYVWSGIWQSMGWDSIIYISALSGVDQELHEAARIDGATRLKRIYYIDLPSIIPTIVMMLILKCGSIMNVGFEKAYLLQNNLNLTTSELIATYSYKVAFNSAATDFGYSTAVTLFNSVINLILIITVNKISKKVTETSLW